MGKEGGGGEGSVKDGCRWERGKIIGVGGGGGGGNKIVGGGQKGAEDTIRKIQRR